MQWVTSSQTTRTRRRGQALEDAIFQAVLDELSTVGYGRMTMEGVAVRAGTAKSSLYRRWATLEDLVITAVNEWLPNPPPLAETGDLRADLVTAMTRMADTLAGPIGRAIGSILGDLRKSPSLQAAAREKVIEPRQRGLRAIFESAAARGEIRAGAITPIVLNVGPAMVMSRGLVQGLPLSRRDIEDIVDQLILPAVR
ncbi:TetR/AcrR family transcriptional regulator [Fodinicola feengrottensis]|uniref:TetR/AcrR family transcriptional regulator n=1 Tax=Fodinicola feengrottensis TaxID=435914 RepID=A0ABN2IZE0_9ACTN